MVGPVFLCPPKNCILGFYIVSMHMSYLSLHQLHKSFGQVAAVRDISLEVEKGETLVILGESGCGKTTLLRLAAGLEEPDSGEVRLAGKRLWGAAHRLVPGHSQVKMLTQDSRLPASMRVEELLNRELLGYVPEERRRRVGWLLDWCGGADWAGRYPRELSGGQQQRVALALALATQPEVLLLDEPFSHLDAHLRMAFRRDLREAFRHFGTTVLLVTHDVQDGLVLAHRMAILQAGRMVREGTPMDIYAYPGSYYAALLFGELNLLPERLRQYIAPDRQEIGLIRVAHTLPAAREEALVTGQVTDIWPMGSYVRVEVQDNGGHTWVLHSPQAPAALGQTLGLRWQKEHLMWVSREH